MQRNLESQLPQESLVEAVHRMIGYRFSDTALLERALKHSSLELKPTHNQDILSAIGVGVGELAVSDIIRNEYFHVGGLGTLRELRAQAIDNRVSGKSVVAQGLRDHMRIGPMLRGAIRDGHITGHEQLAASARAVLGAVYLEAGLPEALRIAKSMYSDGVGVRATYLSNVRDQPLPGAPVVKLAPRDVQEVLEYKFSSEGMARLSEALGQVNDLGQRNLSYTKLSFLGEGVRALLAADFVMRKLPGELHSAPDTRLILSEMLTESGIFAHTKEATLSPFWTHTRNCIDYVDLRHNLGAIFGAMYLDGGFKKLQFISDTLFGDYWSRYEKKLPAKEKIDSKTEFQALSSMYVIGKISTSSQEIFEAGVPRHLFSLQLGQHATYKGVGDSAEAAERAAYAEAVMDIPNLKLAMKDPHKKH